MPAGPYTVGARLDTPAGKITTHKDGVIVKPGVETSLRIALNGVAHVRVEFAAAKPDSNVTIGMVKPGEEKPLGTIAAFEDSIVPAGTYDLRIEETHDGKPHVHWRRGVKLPPGEKTLVTINPGS